MGCNLNHKFITTGYNYKIRKFRKYEYRCKKLTYVSEMRIENLLKLQQTVVRYSAYNIEYKYKYLLYYYGLVVE